MPLPLRIIQGGTAGPEAPEALVAALRARQAWALDALAAEHGPRIERVLTRILGAHDPEKRDLLHETFARAIEHIGQLADPRALGGWLMQMAVFVARECIRKRQRTRRVFSSDAEPDAAAPDADDGVREATRCVYAIFERMPPDERIVLALRRIEELELQELALALDVSVPTVRRRLARAEKRFDKLAARFEALTPWRATR